MLNGLLLCKFFLCELFLNDKNVSCWVLVVWVVGLEGMLFVSGIDWQVMCFGGLEEVGFWIGYGSGKIRVKTGYELNKFEKLHQ